MKRSSAVNPSTANRPRDRAEQEAHRDPRWAVRDAERIADHARLRSEYAGYRNRFFSERARGDRCAAGCSLGAGTDTTAARCPEAPRSAPAIARRGAIGHARSIARQLAYWSIDAIIGCRRAKEYDTARVRWESTKIVLASERKRAREEKPMDYRSFVNERARRGDLGARRVIEALVPPTRERKERVSQAEPRRVTLEEVRLRLNVIRAEEERRFQRARVERRGLEHIERPPTLEEAVATERRRIQERAAEATRYIDVERARLEQLAKEKRSWNPLTRRAAAKEEQRLRGEQSSRYDKALSTAIHEFEQRDVPQIEKQLAGHERLYRQYAGASLGLEREINAARDAQDRISKIEQQLNILERAGVPHVDCQDALPKSALDELATAVDTQYRALPETLRRDVEYSIRREQRARDRSRESISIGDL